MADAMIKRVRLEGMHGHQRSCIDLHPGLNIIYGKNGTGKTTLLHSIVNLLELDIERFLHIRFKEIEITTTEDRVILLTQTSDNHTVEVKIYLDNIYIDKCTIHNPMPDNVLSVLGEIFSKKPVYLPAYRSILEGSPRNPRYQLRSETEITEDEFKTILNREIEFLRKRRNNVPHPYYLEQKAEITASKTFLCRSWFGKFAPVVRYPSISEVQRELDDEVERARFIVAAQDEKNISTVFKNVLEVVLSKKETIIEEDVDSLVNRVHAAVQDLEPGDGSAPTVYGEIAGFLKKSGYSDIASSSDLIKGILKVYDDALSTRKVHKVKAYSDINAFVSSVNLFLETKPLGYSFNKPSNRSRGHSFITLPGGKQVGFNVLSSGERHIVTLLFAATHMSPSEGIVLIDEPELSLHIDWQRIIVGEICKQAKDRQVIACTHSPEVAADNMEAYIDLVNLPEVIQVDGTNAEQLEIDLEN
jgi:AAA15 family ATPase/GTPase